MAEKYMFFDSIDGEDERFYTADEFAEYFRQFIRNGIFTGGDNLKVGAKGQDMKVFIKPGYAWLEGYLYKIDIEPLTLEHDIADAELNRIDRIVIRLDKSLEKRYVKAFVLKGEAAEIPTAPDITRNENIYEMGLAQVEIIGGKSFIENYQITDERLNSEVCGIVTHLFEQVDTTAIYQEWINYLNAKKIEGDDRLLSWQDYLMRKEIEVNQAVTDFIFFLQDAEDGDITRWLEDFKLLIQVEWQQWFDEQQTEGFMMLGDGQRFVNKHSSLNQRVDTRKEEFIYDSTGTLIKVIEKDGGFIVKDTQLEYDSNGDLLRIVETIPGPATDKVITQYLIYDLKGDLQRVERSVN
jgi:hypothetical protein